MSAPWRPELHVEEIPAPQRIAPYSAAHHRRRAGRRWRGAGQRSAASCCTTRPAMPHGRAPFAASPSLGPTSTRRWSPTPCWPSVGWSWLIDALDSHGADYEAPSGTVTSVSSDSFGGMASEPPRAEIEIRASWTPQLLAEGTGLSPHLAGWAELLCTLAGLPPLPAGVVMMPSRRKPPSRSSRRH